MLPVVISRCKPGPSLRRDRVRAGSPRPYHHGRWRDAAVIAVRAALDRGEPLPPMRELGAACGVSHPSLYFSTVEDLLLSVAASCVSEFAVHITAAIARDRH